MPGGQWAADARLAPAVAAARYGDAQDTPQPQSPFCASTRLLAVLARPPSREVPGLRFTLQPEFDLTPETSTTADIPALMLGQILDRNRIPAGPLTLPAASLNRHVFVSGATGSGKSRPSARCSKPRQVTGSHGWSSNPPRPNTS
jgi:hypothetical protein